MCYVLWFHLSLLVIHARFIHKSGFNSHSQSSEFFFGELGLCYTCWMKHSRPISGNQFPVNQVRLFSWLMKCTTIMLVNSLVQLLKLHKKATLCRHVILWGYVVHMHNVWNNLYPRTCVFSSLLKELWCAGHQAGAHTTLNDTTQLTTFVKRLNIRWVYTGYMVRQIRFPVISVVYLCRIQVLTRIRR